MTKSDLVNVIKTQTDIGFLTSIFETTLNALPKAYADNLIYELYATRIYDGQVYTLTHAETHKQFHFAGASDVHEFFKNINNRYSKDNLFRVRNYEGRTLYGYSVECTDKNKKEIIN